MTSVLVITRYQQLGSFNDKNFFLGILEAEKSNIKVETKWFLCGAALVSLWGLSGRDGKEDRKKKRGRERKGQSAFMSNLKTNNPNPPGSESHSYDSV